MTVPEKHKPFTFQFVIERWMDGLKVLGAGNGTGVIASGAGLQYFAGKPDLLFSLKLAGAFFLLGVICFALAFFVLTAIIFAFDKFLAFRTERRTRGFHAMLVAFVKTQEKRERRMYGVFILSSLISVLMFFGGCMMVLLVILHF
jgi:hypothetical protein